MKNITARISDDLAYQLKVLLAEKKLSLQDWLEKKIKRAIEDDKNSPKKISCQYCGKFIGRNEGITTVEGYWVCDSPLCHDFDKKRLLILTRLEKNLVVKN